MGKVESFVCPGLHLWFNSSDHIPPHFHVVKTGEWEVRVYFLLCTEGHLEFQVKWPRSFVEPSRRERSCLLENTLKYRSSLMEEWEAKVSVGGK